MEEGGRKGSNQDKCIHFVQGKKLNEQRGVDENNIRGQLDLRSDLTNKTKENNSVEATTVKRGIGGGGLLRKIPLACEVDPLAGSGKVKQYEPG